MSMLQNSEELPAQSQIRTESLQIPFVDPNSRVVVRDALTGQMIFKTPVVQISRDLEEL